MESGRPCSSIKKIFIHILISSLNIKLINIKLINLREKFTLRNIFITLVNLVFAYLFKLYISYLLTLDMDTWKHYLLLGFIFESLYTVLYCMDTDIDDLSNPGSTPRPSGAALPPQPQPQPPAQPQPTAQPQVPVQQLVIQQPPTQQPHGVMWRLNIVFFAQFLLLNAMVICLDY